MSPVQESIVELPIADIERGFFQPREYFDAEAMEATKRSIQEKGQKYPVIVRPILVGNPLFDANWEDVHYELADGERRYRCCKELGFSTLKALIRNLTDEEMLDYTLTTNDSLPLNPIEKAIVFSRLAKEFGKSQSDIAQSFNLKQQQVSEYIRLLELPKEIQDLTARAVISVRHARELLKIQDSEKMAEMAKAIQDSALSTRALTKILKNDKKIQKKDGEKIDLGDIYLQDAKADVKIAENPENIEVKVKEFGSNLVRPLPGEHVIDEKHSLAAPFWLEQIQRKLIPLGTYQKMEYWLSFELGSRLKPEAWLLRVELAVLAGVFLSVLGLWLPLHVLLTLLALTSTLLVYLYIA